jgi:thioredoxin-related protein
MKRFLLFTCVLGMFDVCVGQDVKINFQEKSYQEILSSLQANNAMACLYFNFDACGGCKKMEKEVFTVDSVAAFYNLNFENYSVNTQEPLGIEVNEHFGVKGQPKFIFINENGDLIHEVGYLSPELFYEHGLKAKSVSSGLIALEKRYKNGDRSPELLYALTDLRYKDYDMDSTIVLEYLATQTYGDLSLKKNIEYIYQYCVLYGTRVSFGIEHPAFKHMWENQDIYKKYFDERQVYVRLLFLANSSCNRATNTTEFETALTFIQPFENNDTYYHKDYEGSIRGWINSENLVLKKRMAWVEKKGDFNRHKQLRSQLVEVIKNDWKKLNEYAWHYTYPPLANSEELNHAISCIKMSINLNKNYDNLDTYAHLLYLIKDYSLALSKAQEAIAVAEEENRDYGDTEKLIKKIKEDM